MHNSQTPIDIHCSKLIDWLVQRRHCRKDWGENLGSIRRKIRAALKDMPENEEIKQLLVGSKLDYFKSKRIVEILRHTEASSKNIFGYYSSQRMKDWQDIVNCYENNCVYLAEVATDLIRETNYEVAGIRKVVGKLNREKDEVDKEKSNLLRRAQQFNAEYQRMAQSYGIKGVNVGQELEQQSTGLSSIMADMVDIAKQLDKPLEYYRQFAATTSRLDAAEFLAILAYMINYGNTTVYEWKYGHRPERVEKAEKAPSSTDASNPSAIDFGDDEIDFGEDLPSSESSSGFVHVEKSDNGASSAEEAFIQVEQQSEPPQICDLTDKVARGDDAKLILEFRKTRSQLMNNLYELEAFYVQLLNELSNENDRTVSFMVDTDTNIPRCSQSEINQNLAKIRKILATANADKNKILFQMNDSQCFLENLKDKFSSKLKQVSDCNIKADLLSERVQEIDAQLRETEIHLKRSIIAAKELQQKVESCLTELYSGRPINIMGCVG